MLSLRMIVVSSLLLAVSALPRKHPALPTSLVNPSPTNLISLSVYATPTTTIPLPNIVETVLPAATPIAPPRDVLRELMAAPPDGKHLQIVGVEPRCWGTAWELQRLDDVNHLMHIQCEQEIAALPREMKTVWAADLLPQNCQMTAERNWVGAYDPNPVTGFFNNKPAAPLPNQYAVHPCTQEIGQMTELMRNSWVDGVMPPQCPLPWAGHEQELLALEAATKLWCEVVTNRLMEIAHPWTWEREQAAAAGGEESGQ